MLTNVKDHYFVYLVYENMLSCFYIQEKHYFSNTVHYCRSSMPCLSLTLCFLQSLSFWQAQSAPIGQVTLCIVIGRTPQARVGNVTPFSIIASFGFKVRFSINSSPRGEQSHVTDSDDTYCICVCTQAAVKMISDALYTLLWCDPPLTHTHRHTHTQCVTRKAPHLNSQ